jgi:DNA-binding response OmpR family regulator
MPIGRILSVAFGNESQTVARNSVLAQAGYAVAPANSTTKAFQLLDFIRFHLVVLGHSIPMSERRLLTLEIQRKWNIPVLSVDAGEIDRELRVEAHSDNLDRPEELLAAVADLLPPEAARR